MKICGVESHLPEDTEISHEKSEAFVRVSNRESESVKVDVSLRQGFVSSLWLSNVIPMVMKEMTASVMCSEEGLRYNCQK